MSKGAHLTTTQFSCIPAFLGKLQLDHAHRAAAQRSGKRGSGNKSPSDPPSPKKLPSQTATPISPVEARFIVEDKGSDFHPKSRRGREKFPLVGRDKWYPNLIKFAPSKLLILHNDGSVESRVPPKPWLPMLPFEQDPFPLKHD